MPNRLPMTEAEIAWPTDLEAEKAMMGFADTVQRHYGDRLRGIYLFGSRARGDHRPESDADIAVILEDGDWVEWKERWTLVDLAFSYQLNSGLAIQPWPLSVSQWQSVESEHEFLQSARREAQPIEVGQ